MQLHRAWCRESRWERREGKLRAWLRRGENNTFTFLEHVCACHCTLDWFPRLLSVSPSVCLLISVSHSLSSHPVPPCLSLSVLSVCLCLPVCRFLCLSLYLYIYISIFISLSDSLCARSLSVCLIFSLSLSFHVCFYVSTLLSASPCVFLIAHYTIHSTPRALHHTHHILHTRSQPVSFTARHRFDKPSAIYQ